MATRDSMNMGSRTNNLIIDVKNGISGWRQEASLFRQEMESTRSVVSSVADKFKSFFGGGGGQGAGGSSNQVAPNPVFHIPFSGAAPTEPRENSVAAGPSTPAVGGGGFSGGGATNLTHFVGSSGGGTLYQSESGGGGGGGGGGGNKLFGSGSDSSSTSRTASMLGIAGSVVTGLFAGYNIAADMLPGTSDILEAQLLRKRASYFRPGTGMTDQQAIANAAMLSGENPQMDVFRAQIAAQSYGLTGGGIDNLMLRAANVSNLMPGIGVEGAMRATGAMQQAYNVNMLRGIGIQIRNADGSLKGIDQVIDDLWQKICRDFSQSGQGAAPNLQQVQISLQPGNALDSMLNQYFGNDPMLKQLVANGLIFKAKGGGAINKGNLEAQGATTAAMLQYTTTAAAGQTFLTSPNVVSGAEEGFKSANSFIQSYYTTMTTSLNEVTKGILALKSTIDTALTAFNGNLFSLFAGASATTPVGAAAVSGFASTLQGLFSLTNLDPTKNSLISPLINFFKNPLSILTALTNTAGLTGMASGGSVDASTPYIIGEKGPELFIPNSSGTIVPNDKLSGSNNTYNFTVNVPNGNSQEVIAAIKNFIYELDTSKRVSES